MRQTPHRLFRDFSAFRCASLRHRKPAQIKALQPKPESFADAGGRNALDVAHFVAQGKRPPSKFGLALCVTTPEGHAPKGGRGPLLKNGNEATDVVTKNFLSGELQQLRRDMRQLSSILPPNAPDPRGGAQVGKGPTIG